MMDIKNTEMLKPINLYNNEKVNYDIVNITLNGCNNFENKQDLCTTIYNIKTSNETLPDNIKLIKKKDTIVFPELYNLMCDLKSKIDKPENLKLWDKAKIKVNPYEFVNVSGTNILQTEKIKIKYENYMPLSRAFFKLTEIWKLVDIIPEKYKNTPGIISNMAEGPGGFIEAIYKQRTVSGITDTFYATTLHSKNKNIPGWGQLLRRRDHFLNNKNVILKTGDLYKTSTILNYANLFKEKKAFLVTCDGGFDYSNDFNNQEKNSRKIIYAEIITTLLIQEKGGNMVCKMFDIFTYFSIQLIYLLSIFYEKINIIKPVTSRPANSEKYIIASGFKSHMLNNKFIKSMLNELEKWDTICDEKYENFFTNSSNKLNYFTPYIKNEDLFLDTTITKNKFKDTLLNVDNELIINNLEVPEKFIEEIKNINILLTNNQKEYITKTLEYIQNYNLNNIHYDKSYQLKYSNIWFDNYNIVKKENL